MSIIILRCECNKIWDVSKSNNKTGSHTLRVSRLAHFKQYIATSRTRCVRLNDLRCNLTSTNQWLLQECCPTLGKMSWLVYGNLRRHKECDDERPTRTSKSSGKHVKRDEGVYKKMIHKGTTTQRMSAKKWAKITQDGPTRGEKLLNDDTSIARKEIAELHDEINERWSRQSRKAGAQLYDERFGGSEAVLQTSLCWRRIRTIVRTDTEGTKE